MKKIIFSLIILLSTQAFIKAQGLLAFFSENGEKFWVVIDGKKINKEPKYLVDSIPFNMQWGKAKIIFEDSKLPSFDKSFQVVDADGKFCYVKYIIYKKKDKYNAKVSSFMPLNSTHATTSSQTSSPSVQPTQQTNPETQTFQQTTTVTDPTTNTNINMGVGVNVTETQDGVNMNIHIPGVQTTTQASAVTTTTTTTTTVSQPTQQSQATIKPKPQMQTQPVQETKPAGGCISPMSDMDFQSAKKSIASKSFEDSKLTTAKQIVSANCVLSSQVKEIMDLFGFENTRIEFAKFAYKYTYDKNNYYKVNEGFKFETSIDELNEYLNSGN